MMGVTLYTSRVVLNALGVEDYGIYNVVGGFVIMFTMISSALSGAISRFITFELGKGNQERLNTIFSTSIIIQIIIAIIIAILVETIGLWFLTNKMVIPPDRLLAAKWVLQLSLITLAINLISIPYNATIIAHERMSAFAYISIIDALGKLAIAYFINFAPIDRLIFYAIMMSAVAFIVQLTYAAYCNRHFIESKFRLVFDRQLLSEMFNFAGWNFFGTASALIRDQGGNMIINILGGGPAVNAARGISNQVNSAITGFSSNFMVALDPQITKSYATGNTDYLMKLIFRGARYAVYMLLALSLPVIISTPYLLSLWLKTVPEYTVAFVQLALIFGICDAIARPAIMAISATGNIKKCQIIVGCVQVMNLPISFLLLKMGLPPTYVLIVAIALVWVCMAVRIIMLRSMIGLSVRAFIKDVILNLVLVAGVSLVAPLLMRNFIANDNFWGCVFISFVSLISSAITTYFIGCDRGEKTFINNKIKQLKGKIL